MEEMNYLDFLEEVKTKNVDEIYKYLNEQNILINEVSATDEFLIVGEVIRRINLCDREDSNQYSFLKRSIIYFEVIENYTNLNISSLDMGMENYNISIELALKKNDLIFHFYQSVQDVLKEQEIKIIGEMCKILDSASQMNKIDSIEQSINNMFSGISDDKLKLIDGILAYNDPTLKAIKDNLLDQTLMTEDNKKQVNQVIDKMETLLEKEIKENGDDINGDSRK